MTDNSEDGDNENSEETSQSNIHPADLYSDDILYASQNKNGERAAIDMLLLARKLQKMSERDIVCDDQAALVAEAVEAIIEAADATWPGDNTTVPPIEHMAEWPEADANDEREDDSED